MPSVDVYGSRAIPAAIKRAVLDRDGMTCRHCGSRVRRAKKGEPYDPRHLHFDHVEHWASGGEHAVDNLVVACAGCNLARPKPTTIVRQSSVRVERRDGTFYWPAGYTPPVVASVQRDDLRSAERLAGMLALTPLAVLRMVVGGQLAATATSPIRVQPPQFILDDLREHRAAARQARLERQREAAKARRGRPAVWSVPDAARSGTDAQWNALIERMRARRQAAR